MTGNDIYYYLSPLHLSLPRKLASQPRPEARGRFFLTIWDPEAVDPRYTGGKGSGLAKLCRAIADLKRWGYPWMSHSPWSSAPASPGGCS